MKSRLIILTIFLMSMSVVSAQYCGQSSGGEGFIMFSYSSPTNAHVGYPAFVTHGYPETACYNELFGETVALENGLSRNCNELPVMFYLSNTSYQGDPGNAHVSALHIPGYDIPLCYSDFICGFDGPEEPIVPNSPCFNSSYTVVARASNLTNAHIEAPNGTNYPYKICCKRDNFTSAEWQLPLNTPALSPVYVDNSLFAVAFDSTGNHKIEIFEEDGGINPDDLILEVTGYTSPSSPNWVYEWKFNASDVFDKTEDDYDNFYFRIDGNNQKESQRVKIQFCGDKETQLAYGEECDDGPYSAPSGGVYNQNTRYCNPHTCQLVSEPSEYCGDEVVQGGYEDCDLGIGVNGNLSAQEAAINSGEKFCSIDCVNETRVISDLRWESLSGSEISHAGRGDTVKLVHIGNSLSQVFTIFEDGQASPFQIISGSVSGTNTSGSWSIPSSLAQNSTKFRFNSSVLLNGQSNILTITPEGNQPIRISIGSDPSTQTPCGATFSVGTTRDIAITVVDPDDTVSGHVEIGGVRVTSFTNEVSYTFSRAAHNFTDEGTTKIEVFAENSRGEKASAVSNLIVHDLSTSSPSQFTAACIKEPSSFKYLSEEYVEFDASTSKGYREAGSTTISHTRLEYKWRFSDGRSNPYGETPTDPRAYRFMKSFASTPGYNWADLEVSIA